MFFFLLLAYATAEIRNLGERIKRCTSPQDHVKIANVVVNNDDYKWAIYLLRTLNSALQAYTDYMKAFQGNKPAGKLKKFLKERNLRDTTMHPIVIPLYLN